MKNKKRKSTVSEASIPAGVYQELDNDIARDNVENDIPVADLAELHIGGTTAGFPLGVYPVFDDNFPRDNAEDNMTATNSEGVWSDPRMR